MTTKEILVRAKSCAPRAALLSTQKKNEALLAMADALVAATEDILSANQLDVQAAQGIIAPVMLDRLSLNESRIRAMAEGIRQVAELPDPVGRVRQRTAHKKGMVIQKVGVPMGVVAIIYESRPNVTSDAAALAIKSGNACVLRGGKEAFRSANAIVKAMQQGLMKVGLEPELVQLVQDTTRASAQELMTAVGYVDLLIPRGGAGLIRACVENASVPCIQTGTGICHIYVDKDADQDKALEIIKNAKTSRPSVCNAAEVCLVHRDIAAEFLPKLQAVLTGVELRLDGTAQTIISGTPAGEADFDTEFLDYILAVKVVDCVDEALCHIAEHSTHHSDAIVTENQNTAEYFLCRVDTSCT